MSLVVAGLLTQELEPDSTMIVDARNGFNELIRLLIMWNV